MGLVLRGGGALALLVVGVAGGLAAVLLHQGGWGLALGLAAATATTLALPRGWWTRVAFMLGWTGAVVRSMLPRVEGDYLIPANTAGYTLVVGSLLVLLLALGTSGPARGSRDDLGDPTFPT